MDVLNMDGARIPTVTSSFLNNSDIDMDLDLGFDFQDFKDADFIESTLIDDDIMDIFSSDDADDCTLDFSVASNGTLEIPSLLSQFGNQPHRGKPLKRLNRKKKKGSRKISSARTADALGGLVAKVPNISRRNTPRGLKLYAFPSFDKCDSLIYLPSSMARHINSSDIKSLRGLLRKHMDSNCKVSFGPLGDVIPGPSMIVAMFEAMVQFYPDSLMVAQTDKVEDDSIVASIAFKYTDCQELVDLMRTSTSVQSNPFTAMHHQPRRDRLLLKLEPKERSVEELQALMGLFDNTQEDLLVHGSGSMKINFDNFTRKITSFELDSGWVSITAKSSPLRSNY